MAAIAPWISVLHACYQRLADVDLPTRTGVADLKLRFARNRYASRAEKPSVSLAFVSDAPRDGEESALGELPRQLAIDIIVDMEIDSEASAEEEFLNGTALDAFDPSGLSALSTVLVEVHAALKECMFDPHRDDTDLGRKIDWIEEVSVDDDEDLSDYDGRLVGRVNVIYRASSWDPTQLFERN